MDGCGFGGGGGGEAVPRSSYQRLVPRYPSFPLVIVLFRPVLLPICILYYLAFGYAILFEPYIVVF